MGGGRTRLRMNAPCQHSSYIFLARFAPWHSSQHQTVLLPNFLKNNPPLESHWDTVLWEQVLRRSWFPLGTYSRGSVLKCPRSHHLALSCILRGPHWNPEGILREKSPHLPFWDDDMVIWRDLIYFVRFLNFKIIFIKPVLTQWHCWYPFTWMSF